MRNFLTTPFKKIIILLLLSPSSVFCLNGDLYVKAHSDFTDVSIENTTEMETQDPFFDFVPERWGIVQGIVSDEIALKNKKILNSVMAELKEKNINTMKIGTMDAYFKVDLNSINRKKNSDESIQIPSNFHLVMSDDTYLRVQPNGSPTYTLISTYLTDNSKISGGNLVGDRFEHDYSPAIDEVGVNRNEHGWGFILFIIGSHNVTIDNVNISKASGDGIAIHAKTLRRNDGTLGPNGRETNNVLIKNSIITECRRNNISILDGNNITIENCFITDSGQGTQAYDENGKKIKSSAGTAPRYGIDLEAIRTYSANGTLNETAIIKNVNIRNSTFTGNAAGDIVLFTCSNTIVENNYFDKWVANFASNDIIIRNNVFEAREPKISFGINIKSYKNINDKELNYNYSIIGNTISGGYKSGLSIAGKNHEIKDNIITDCEIGIQLKGSFDDGVFSNNTIESNLPASFGYKSFNNSQGTNNVVISNDYINVTNRPISLIGFNSESTLSNAQITWKNCTLNSQNNNNFFIHINKSKNIEFNNNVSNTRFEIIDSNNIILNNNAVSQ